MTKFAIAFCLFVLLLSPSINASQSEINNWGKPLTNLSSTINTGGVAQVAIPANTKRQGFIIQNQHAVTNLYVNITCGPAAANQTSIILVPNGSYESPEKNAPLCDISVYSATTSAPYYAAEW